MLVAACSITEMQYFKTETLDKALKVFLHPWNLIELENKQITIEMDNKQSFISYFSFLILSNGRDAGFV